MQKCLPLVHDVLYEYIKYSFNAVPYFEALLIVMFHLNTNKYG
jgi:hypothetical protein